jgi:hypothetical protein
VLAGFAGLSAAEITLKPSPLAVSRVAYKPRKAGRDIVSAAFFRPDSRQGR